MSKKHDKLQNPKVIKALESLTMEDKLEMFGIKKTSKENDTKQKK